MIEHPHTSSSAFALMKRLLLAHVWPYRKKVALAIACMIAAAVMAGAKAYVMQPMLDDVFIKKEFNMLVVISLAVLVIFIVSSIASYGQTLFMRYVGQRVICDMQIRLFAHLMKSDLKLFHDQSAGHLISRFTNDIQMMRNAVTTGLTTITREFLSMLALIGVMIYQSWELTLIAAAVFPLAIWPVMRLSKRMRKIADGTQQELGDFTARLDEIFQGVRTVKSYNRERHEEARANAIIERLFGLYYKASRVQAAASPLMEVLSGVAIAGVIVYGGLQVMEGVTTTGAFFSFITAFIMAYRPVKALAGLNTTLQEGISAANRYFAAIDVEPIVHDRPGAEVLEVTQGEIEFRDVSFHYGPGTGGVEQINFKAAAGEKIALVGHSGGGKTTLFNLLLRFYEMDAGNIFVEGADIRDVTQASLRESMSFVPQETVLFDDTIRSNIAYGRLDASEDEIIAAAQGAAAHEFIEQLPQGYDTMIGPHGVKLSGGQRQRLAIARAMLKDAPILLLDEATSALDNTSERQVQEALDRLMQGRTTLIIAHRLSTVMRADCIYVVENGRIAESGTHDALLQQAGAYHRLYAEQLAATA